MKRIDLVYALSSSLVAYALIYFTLYAIKTDTSMGTNSLIILLMLWVLMLTHPFVRNSESFKKVFQSKK